MAGWFPPGIVLFWGFSAGLWCQQVGFLTAAVARLALFSGVHALALTHSFRFCRHVHSVYMSITCALGNRWPRLANVKSFCLLGCSGFFTVVDASWSASTCNTQVFTLHAVTQMFIHRPPCLLSSQFPNQKIRALATAGEFRYVLTLGHFSLHL